jgi:hypothetical protein
MIKPRSKLAWTNQPEFNTTKKYYNCWDSTRIYYLVLKICGFIAYSVEGKIENGRIKIKLADIFIMLTALTTYTFILYINFGNDLTLIQTKSPTIDVGNRLIYNFTIINIFLTVIVNFIMRHSIWGIVRNFSKFDKDVSVCVQCNI